MQFKEGRTGLSAHSWLTLSENWTYKTQQYMYPGQFQQSTYTCE